MSPSPRKTLGRHAPKARSGCWSCKERKVKCSEEKPSCRACKRLGLTCRYQVRLKWGSLSEAIDDDDALPSREAFANIPNIPAQDPPKNYHFVHFTLQDFGSGDASENSEEGYSSSAVSSPRSVLRSSPSKSSVNTSTSASPSSFVLLEEPAWFPALEYPSPLDEMLFMYYTIEIVPRCTMHDDSSNGFRSIIIPMSATDCSVLHSILAVAAYSLKQSNPSYHLIALEQKEKALVYIRREVFSDKHHRHTYEKLVAVAIMLCVFEIKDGSGPDWGKHLNGGKAILQSKIHRPGSGVWGEGISWWANKFFAYQSVNGISTSAESSELLETPELWLSQGLKVQDIDGFMGCSSEMMALTAAVTNMARQQCSGLLRAEDVGSRSNHLERALCDIRQHSQALGMCFSESLSMAEVINNMLKYPNTDVRPKILALTAEARRQASFVLLCVSVKKLPAWRQEVHSRVTSCLLCISAISILMDSEDAPLWGMSPLVWPLFVAGAASTADYHRYQVVEVFKKLGKAKRLGNVKRAQDTIMSIWKRHDMAANGADHTELWKLYMDRNVDWPLSLG